MASRRALRSSTAVGMNTTHVLRAQEHITTSKEIQEELAPDEKAPQVKRKKRNVDKNEDAAVAAKKIRRGTPDLQLENDTNAANGLVDRPAEPHRTNAPLITPKGSRYVTYPQGSLDKTPKAGLPRPTTTTGHILDQACAHLIMMDHRLQPLIEKHYCRIFCPEGLAEECDPFKSLCSGIMAQQVSGAAAASIKKKFISLFHSPGTDLLEESKSFPNPAQVAACNVPFLRQAGLSERKAEYIKGLAEKFASGELSTAMLMNASDEEVLETLTAVRGLGKWSVEMFACFGLKRMDILSTGDLGVQYDQGHHDCLKHADLTILGEAWLLSWEKT